MNYPELDVADFDQTAVNEALQQRHYSKASRIFRQAMALGQSLGTIDPSLLLSANELADNYLKQGDYFRAASLYRAILDVKTKSFGTDHEEVREISKKLTLALWQTGGITPRLLEVD